MRPLPRFIALGGLLFAVRLGAGGVGPAGPAAPGTPLADDALLFRTALARGLHEHDPLVRRRLVRNLRFALDAGSASEATLLREALALGLHESDPVVRRRLVERMRAELRAADARPEPSEAELRAFHAAHPERWRIPGRIRITQVPETPLPVPVRLPPLSERELAGRFGPAFARSVFALPVGVEVAEVASTWGRHRVVVHGREPEGVAPFRAVRTQVREALRAERDAQTLGREITRMRQRWRIPVPPLEPA